MTRTQLLQELRRMRFQEAYGGWRERRLTQEEAARLLGVCERTFRRYVDRYEDEGLDGLVDKRLSQVSARRAPVDEVVRTEALYRERYDGWNVAHFYSFYRRRHGGERSYTWVKSTLQRAGLVAKAPGRCALATRRRARTCSATARRTRRAERPRRGPKWPRPAQKWPRRGSSRRPWHGGPPRRVSRSSKRALAGATADRDLPPPSPPPAPRAQPVGSRRHRHGEAMEPRPEVSARRHSGLR